MHTIFQQYDERLNRLNRSESHIQNFRRSVDRFEEFLDEIGVTATDAEGWMVEEFLARTGFSPKSKRVTFSHLRSAYRYAHQRKMMDSVPTAYVETEKIPESEPEIIPNSELREVMARCYDRRQWLLFHLYAYTGVRRDEGRTLEWEAIDLSANTIRVVGKGSKFRLVPIHPALGEILAETERQGPAVLPNRNGTALSYTGLRKQLQKIAPGRGFHDFRRTVASSLFRNGVQPDTIDRIMGWSPSTIRSKYYQNIADDLLQEAILKLYRDDPLTSL